MSKDFQQSPMGRSLTALQYLQRAAQAIESQIEQDGEVPPWVQIKIRESAMSLGMAVAYIRQRQGKKEKKG